MGSGHFLEGRRPETLVARFAAVLAAGIEAGLQVAQEDIVVVLPESRRPTFPALGDDHKSILGGGERVGESLLRADAAAAGIATLAGFVLGQAIACFEGNKQH